MFKIGYIDDESSFLGIFRDIFREDYSVELFEIEEYTTASSLTDSINLHHLHMLIIDFKLNENGNDYLDGNQVAKEVRKIRPKLPLLILTSDQDDTLTLVDNSLLLHGKDELDPENIDIFKIKIASAIKSFDNDIKENKEIVKRLSEKNLENQLLAGEKETLFKAYSYLNEVFPNEKTFQEYLSKPSEIEELVALLETSNNLIDELKKKV